MAHSEGYKEIISSCEHCNKSFTGRLTPCATNRMFCEGGDRDKFQMKDYKCPSCLFVCMLGEFLWSQVFWNLHLKKYVHVICMWFSYFLTILISFYICWDTHSPWNKPVTYPLLTRSICRTKWIICIGETPYTLCTHIIRHGLDLAKFIAELALYVPKKVRVVLLSKFGKSKLPSPKTVHVFY